MPARFMTRKPEHQTSWFIQQIEDEFEDRATCARVLGNLATRSTDFADVAQHIHDLYDTPFTPGEEVAFLLAEALTYDSLRERGMID